MWRLYKRPELLAFAAWSSPRFLGGDSQGSPAKLSSSNNFCAAHNLGEMNLKWKGAVETVGPDAGYGDSVDKHMTK